MSSVPRGFAPVDVTVGAQLLGFDVLPRRAVKRRPPADGETLPERELLPQMIAIAAVLEAVRPDGEKLYDEVVVQSPRRSAKTTSIWCTLIGRCMSTPGHKIAFTAQSGVKASEIFLDMANQLEQFWHAHHSEWEAMPFRVYRGVGHEQVKFTNGSIIRAYPPDPAALRSAGADTVYIEEAQEFDAQKSSTLLGGILPLMDTMDAPQIIVTGTPGKILEGLLHDSLEAGRRGEIGIVDWSVPTDEHGQPVKDPGDPRTWDQHHPGVGTLTTPDIIRKRFEKLERVQFLREYCCVWPVDTTAKAIDPRLWDAGRIDWTLRVQERPERFAVGFDVALDQSSAAVAVAWRDDRAIAHVEIIAHREGDGWLSKFITDHLRHDRNIWVGFDSIGNNLNIAEELQRVPRGRPRLKPVIGKANAAAAAAIYSAIKVGKLQHYDQPMLNAAVDVATRRGESSESSGWYWGRRRSKGDIEPLVAATIALRTLDQTAPRGTGSTFGGRAGRTTDRPPRTRR